MKVIEGNTGGEKTTNQWDTERNERAGELGNENERGRKQWLEKERAGRKGKGKSLREGHRSMSQRESCRAGSQALGSLSLANKG